MSGVTGLWRKLQGFSTALWFLCVCAPDMVFAPPPPTLELSGQPQAPSPQNTPIAEGLPAALARIMTGRSGTAVVLDVASGQPIASYRLDIAARRTAPPGSAIKPFTLLALLESGKLRAEEPFVCPRRLRVGGRRLDCTHPHTPRAMDGVLALAYSCNAYFAQMAMRLTDEELGRTLSRAGLNSVTGLAPEEASGTLVPSRSPAERQLLALGHEPIAVTPLALAVAYRKLAAALRPENSPSAALHGVLEGLADSAAYGMGRGATVEGMEIAGKTGTAGDGAGGTHAWFAGFAPARQPEVVVLVFLERGTGGADAAPLAAEIFAAWAAGKGAK